MRRSEIGNLQSQGSLVGTQKSRMDLQHALIEVLRSVVRASIQRPDLEIAIAGFHRI